MPKKGEMPRALVTRLARAKAEDARDRIANDKEIADAYVIAADTAVAVGRRILVKPRFVEEAVATLQLLSGRAHRVLTALCLITPDDRVRIKIVDTRVRFKRLSKEETEAYIASREWRGKAGGYAIQGLAGCFVQKIVGSYTNVVGLPLTEIVAMLVGEGFPIHFNWLKAGDVEPD
jgi:septum formation protein